MSDADPREPQNVRIVDAHGVEVPADRIIYVGPDPETGLEFFEAWWFSPDMELGPDSSARVGIMPARTSLGFRFYEDLMDRLGPDL